jgi:hypothetical protein
MYWISATFGHGLRPEDRSRVEELVWERANWVTLAWRKRHVRVQVQRDDLLPPEPGRPRGRPAPDHGGGLIRSQYELFIGLTPSASQEAMDSLVDAIREVPNLQAIELRAEEAVREPDKVKPPHR